MAGIYIHIPFCKQACSYCDFHFSTNLSRKSELIQAILKEMELRSDYLGQEQIDTIYFGGGTPSLLNQTEIELILESIRKRFSLNDSLEITLEANPDDLTHSSLIELKKSGINRLSIGVQSFHTEDLRFMNRAHSAKQAVNCLKNAQDVGFSNLSIDLIFGTQTTSNGMWQKNLELVEDYQIPHLSAYSLTVEENTALANQIEKGKLPAVDEDKNFQQYLYLQEFIQAKGYEQYELSNYCRDGNYSKHNTSYWFGKKYLGLGPSAHSFDENSRQWNVKNNTQYIRKINENKLFSEREQLTEIDQYHDFLITSLRTKWGINFDSFKTKFEKGTQDHFFKAIPKLPIHLVEHTSAGLKVRNKALFRSDEVVRELMF